MASVHFYCQTMVLNYWFLILFTLIIVILLLITKYVSLRNQKIHKIYTKIISMVNKNDIAWLILHLILSFFWINLVFDATFIEYHVIHSCISFIFWGILITIVIISSPEVFTYNFILTIDKSSPNPSIILLLIKNIISILLFVLEGRQIRLYLSVALWLIYLCFILIHFWKFRMLSIKETIQWGFKIVKNSVFLVILFVLMMQELFVSDGSSFIILLSTFFFAGSLIISLYS